MSSTNQRGSISSVYTPRTRRGTRVELLETQPGSLTFADDIIRRASLANPNFGGLQADSKDASTSETSMGFWQAVKLYRKAVAWSLLLSLAVVMEGYDLALLPSFYAIPTFDQRFGNVYLADGSKTVSAAWRSGLGNAASVGEIIGLVAVGILQEKFGYKKTIGSAIVLVACFLFIPFFAKSLHMLLAGQILCGLCWGVFQTITITYASEVTPVALRAYLTTYVNLCWIFGQLIASGVLRAMVDRNDEWTYRIPFAVQWIWPIPILIGSILCPESPWWLVRQGRFEDAKTSLLRLTSRGDPTFDPDKTIAMIAHTTELEQQLSNGTSYLECFRGTNLRRTEIACVTWLVQIVCGAELMGSCAVFFESAGLSPTYTFNLVIGLYALGACGTIAAWLLMAHFGRRTLYLSGASMLFCTLLAIGLCGTHQENKDVKWAIGSLLLIFTLLYDLTVGPICYSLVTEIPSTRLRAKTIALARNTYNIIKIGFDVLNSYMLTPSAWNWGTYSAFFWSGTCFGCIIWMYFRLPEPKGRTYGELDILFDHKVSARNFKSASVDLFRGESFTVVPERTSVDGDVANKYPEEKHQDID